MHEHVDEVVGWIHGHAHLLANRDERLVVEEHAVVVDALGRNEREVEIVAIGERAANVRADEQAGGGRRRPEQRILGRRSARTDAPVASVELIEELGHERRHRDAGHDADPLALEARAASTGPPATRMRSAATAPTPFSICGKSP